MSRSNAPNLSDARLRWLGAEEKRLLRWGVLAVDDVGFAYLDAKGAADPAQGHSLLVTARMTYVYALAARRGHPGAASVRDHGVRSLRWRWGDSASGGWVSRIDTPDGRKSAYDHAFVLLAASAVRATGDDGRALFENASRTVLERFWREDEGAVVDSFAADWSAAEPYRGANANMHMLEAFLAAWAASEDTAWLDRGLRIAERLIDGVARARGWRVLEHFDDSWRAVPEYNSERPADQFRPYGYLVGHSFEWARLLIQLSFALEAAGCPAPAWLRDAATRLWEHALTAGWAADDHPGFAYSLDWSDNVVVGRRLHWVASEAAAAATSVAAIGLAGATQWGERIWADIESRFADPAGSWHHELDVHGRPSATIWQGKPDLYHAYQAVVIASEGPASVDTGRGVVG